MNRKDLPALCKQLRRDIINMIANGASGHPGGSLSVIDMLVALYFGKIVLGCSASVILTPQAI